MPAVTTTARHLARARLFAGLGRAELARIASLTAERRATAGEVLCRQGEPGHELFVVVSGEAEVRRNRRRIRTMGAGDVFGELALLDRAPRSATVTAVTPMRLLVLGEQDFTALLDEVPALPHKLLAQLAAWLRAAEPTAQE